MYIADMMRKKKYQSDRKNAIVLGTKCAKFEFYKSKNDYPPCSLIHALIFSRFPDEFEYVDVL